MTKTAISIAEHARWDAPYSFFHATAWSSRRLVRRPAPCVRARKGDGGRGDPGPPHPTWLLGLAQTGRHANRDVQGGRREARPPSVLLPRRLPDQPRGRRPDDAAALREHAGRLPQGG